MRGLAALVLLGVFAFGAIYFLFPEQVAEAAFKLERSRVGLDRKELDLPASATHPALHIVYLEGGRPQDAAPSLLLIHGVGADKDNWTRSAYYLGAQYHLIALALPGFGESSKPADLDYHIDAQVERIAEFASALHLEHFDLGGNSMGGWLSAEYAAAHPEQVHSLWLLDPGGIATAQPSEMFQRLKAGERIPLFAQNAEQFRELTHFVFVRPPYVPGAVLNILARRQARDYDLNVKIFGELREDLEKRPLESRVKNLATPTLIVWGANDRVLDVSGADVLHGLLPNSQVSIMPNIGHLPMLEAPKASAENYLRFRDTLQSAAAKP